ncbi:MAG: enoyl-CoA hydratase/isomerase family protein [Acidobacteria bacterium]|nr:enoyl-CoA hydratase/isomerase family protein [Acidobacteriota bacterium]
MQAPSAHHVAITLEPPIARLVLAHGKQNVIDFQMMEELAVGLDTLEGNAEISAILISGAGEHFSVGVDIPSHTPEKVETMLTKFHGVIRRLAHTNKVTVALVRGYCLGGGAELAMLCDIVLTTQSAHWGFPEIKLGCYPPVACAGLAAAVGQKRAAELVLTGRIFDGREAAQIGLATRVIEIGKSSGREFPEAADEVERSLKALSPAALSCAKRALYGWDAAHLEKGLARAEEIYLKQLIKTEDAKEGIRAWVEKRDPVWSGK